MWKIALAVAVIYFAASLFIFRGVAESIPRVLRGEAVINGDELVPFFNPSSQLIEQAAGKFNQLTHGYEFRVRYSILTTWMRYYKILPFAIIVVIPAVTYVAYLAVSWLLSRCLPMLPARTIYVVTAGPVGVIFLILTYAKITHFYTLILGFSLFTLAAALVTYGLIFAERRPYRSIAAACLVTLVNPAVHYLILFAIYLSMTVLALLVVEAVTWLRGGGAQHLRWCAIKIGLATRWAATTGTSSAPGALGVLGRLRRLGVGIWSAWGHTTLFRCGVAFVLLGALTLVPYGLFVKFFALRGVPNLSETVPSDFYFIVDASVPWMHMLAFDMSGIMDKMISGDYLAKEPRTTNVIYTVLLLLPLLLPPMRRQLFNTRARRQFLVVAYFNVFFSMWATLGYSDPEWLPTFHRTIALISRTAYSMQSAIGDLILRVTSTIVQVLRFPHRFQLILFMAACVLIPISLAWIAERLGAAIRERARRRPALGRRCSRAMAPTLLALCFLPLFSGWQYRETFLSGNFRNFLAPYPVAPLRAVKDVLLNMPPGKVVVLPPTESAKVVLDISGVEHKFIDKFHIYYLDLPSYYYGLTGDSDNKYEFFLLLRALYYQQDWWVNIARDLDLRYLVINKELIANTVGGAEYLREIERIIIPQMDKHDEYLRKLYQNDSYVVYQFTHPPAAERRPLLVAEGWNSFVGLLSSWLDLTRFYDLRHTVVSDDLTDYAHLDLITDDLRTATLDLYAKANAKQFSVPSSNIFAFNPGIIPSSYYLSPMFRLFQLFSDSKWNRLNMITPGLFGTIAGSFIGVPRATQFRIDVKFPEDGTYRLLMRGAATANRLQVRSKKLGYAADVELRAPAGALAFYDQREVFSRDRKPLDIRLYTLAEMERLIPTEIVVVNNRNVYFDLGVVEAKKGAQAFHFNKIDNNPLLVEGILVVPEDVYRDLALPANVRLVESPAALRLTHTQDSAVQTRRSE